ncbi:MAG: MFS transporter [Coriobacteriaceae bacterium]|nr:MFS transporter [Coriobacteriaceae bacterium]
MMARNREKMREEVFGAPEALQAPGNLEAPAGLQAPGVLAEPQALAVPQVPQAPQDPQAPQRPEAPEAPQAPQPRKARGTSQQKAFYGWKLAVIVGFVYLCSGDAVLPTATIVNPMMMADSQVSLSGTVIGAGFSLFVLMQGIPGPFIGHLIERKGARFAMVLGASIMLVGGLAMLFVVRSAVSYLFVFGIVLSVGSIMAGLLSVQTTIGNWFVQQRGKAMTLAMCVAGIGAILVPFIVNLLVEASGGAWQSGWYLEVALAAILIPLALFFVKNKPEEIGQVQDGIDGGASAPVEGLQDKRIGSTKRKGGSNGVYKNPSTVKFRHSVRHPAFWLIALTGTGGFAAYTLAASQGVIHFNSLGFDHDVIVAAVMCMGFAGLGGRLIIGLRSDKTEPVRLMSFSLAVVIGGILAAVTLNHPVAAFLFYLCMGFGFGAVAALLPTAVANYFGIGEFSKNLGTTMLITTLVASCVPVIGGFIYDTTGTCVPAFLIVALIAALCACCGLAVRFPQN